MGNWTNILWRAKRELPSMIGVLLLLILYGWGLTWVWKWFITPFGIQQINTAHAIGLMATVLLFRGRFTVNDLEFWRQITIAALLFVTTWAAHFFI